MPIRPKNVLDRRVWLCYFQHGHRYIFHIINLLVDDFRNDLDASSPVLRLLTFPRIRTLNDVKSQCA